MEIEFKFCIPPERLAAVQAAVRRGRWTPVRMEARYFDTPDAALSSRGIALRLRREGTQWVQTVKALGQGPLDREEHNVVLGDTQPSLVPRPELHAGSVAGARLVAALQVAQGPLAETYGTEMDRVTRDIAFKGVWWSWRWTPGGWWHTGAPHNKKKPASASWNWNSPPGPWQGSPPWRPAGPRGMGCI